MGKDETEHHKAVKEYLLDYNLLKKDLIKVNDGKNGTRVFSTTTHPQDPKLAPLDTQRAPPTTQALFRDSYAYGRK